MNEAAKDRDPSSTHAQRIARARWLVGEEKEWIKTCGPTLPDYVRRYGRDGAGFYLRDRRRLAEYEGDVRTLEGANS